MQIIENLQVKEKLYTEKLENGLTIMIIPKKGIKKNIFNSILVYLYRKSNRIGAIGVNCKILALNDRTKREGRTAFLCIYDIMKAVY